VLQGNRRYDCGPECEVAMRIAKQRQKQKLFNHGGTETLRHGEKSWPRINANGNE